MKQSKRWLSTLRRTVADLTMDQVRILLEQLNEQTEAKWLYMSNKLKIVMEANTDV